MRELMSYLPDNYVDSLETVTFQQALQPEVDYLWAARNGLLAQLNPYSATWGLYLWEDALGLGRSDGLNLNVRRRQVVAKLQGVGATTPRVVKDVAETLLGCPVAVVEHFSQYWVELEIDNGGKLPQGVEQLMARLREIMPAHLGWALVIPTRLEIGIAMGLGPRLSRAALPHYRHKPPVGQFCVTPFLGVRRSTITLPLAAQEG